MTRIKVLALAAAILAPSLAAAEPISLHSEMQAETLRAGAVDMTVFYLERDDHLQIVATYALRGTGSEPMRLQMAMKDGDSVMFGLPEYRGISYRFERTGNVITVENEAQASKSAALIQ